jgi:small-conductance mechanosensitive channel
MHPDLYNVIKFGLRIVIGTSIAISVMVFLNIQTQFILIISGIVATAIAFGSMTAINNFIAGLWLTFSSPFGVGDYVEVGGIEGIVVEISLNYTKIKSKDGNVTLIPNISLVNTKIINYTISPELFEKQIKNLERNLSILEKQLAKKETEESKLSVARLKEEIKFRKQKLDEILKIEALLHNYKKNGDENNKNYSIYARKEKIVRYTFTLEVERSPSRNAQLLDEICDKWTTQFGVRPRWKIMGHSYFIVYLFIIYTPDPMDIVTHYAEFVENVYEAIYTKST